MRSGKTQMKPHRFEVFEGENAGDSTTWCKWCNCTREEANRLGLHVEYGVDEETGEYFVENSKGERIAEGLTFATVVEMTQATDTV